MEILFLGTGDAFSSRAKKELRESLRIFKPITVPDDLSTLHI